VLQLHAFVSSTSPLPLHSVASEYWQCDPALPREHWHRPSPVAPAMLPRPLQFPDVGVCWQRSPPKPCLHAHVADDVVAFFLPLQSTTVTTPLPLHVTASE